MNIKIQVVQPDNMSYRTYEYNDIDSVDKYVQRHNNDKEFVATYEVMTDDNASRSWNDINKSAQAFAKRFNASRQGR